MVARQQLEYHLARLTNDLLGGGIIAFAQTNAVVFDDRGGGCTSDREQTIAAFKITVRVRLSIYLFRAVRFTDWTGCAPQTKLRHPAT